MRPTLSALVLALLMVLAPAATAGYQGQINDTDHWMVLDEREDFYSINPGRCTASGSCGATEALGHFTWYIGDVMDNASAYYEERNLSWYAKGLVRDIDSENLLTTWTLCFYDDNGTKLSCKTGSPKINMYVRKDARYVRLVLDAGVTADGTIRIATSPVV